MRYYYLLLLGIVPIALAVAVLWSPSVTPAGAQSPPARPCADVNGDGRVNLRDIDLILRAVLRGNNNPAFDINNDGRVNWGDIWTAAWQYGRRCSRDAGPTPTATRTVPPTATRTPAPPTATRTPTPTRTTPTATPTVKLD